LQVAGGLIQQFELAFWSWPLGSQVVLLEWPRNRAYTDLCHIDLYYPLFRMIHHISSLFSVHSDHSGNLHVNLVRTCRCKKDVWMQLIIHPESAYISKWMRPQRVRERERDIYSKLKGDVIWSQPHVHSKTSHSTLGCAGTWISFGICCIWHRMRMMMMIFG
jgi:hypothetical protein